MNLFEQICEDYRAHGRDWTRPGFRAVAVHRFGVWRMSVRPKLLRAPLSLRVEDAAVMFAEPRRNLAQDPMDLAHLFFTQPHQLVV